MDACSSWIVPMRASLSWTLAQAAFAPWAAGEEGRVNFRKSGIFFRSRMTQRSFPTRGPDDGSLPLVTQSLRLSRRITQPSGWLPFPLVPMTTEMFSHSRMLLRTIPSA